MAWHRAYHYGIGWRVVWEKDDAQITFQPDQFGKVKSISWSGCLGAPCTLGVIAERVAELLPQLRQHRFGTRHSAERSVLCGRISSHLNGIGLSPMIEASHGA
jgi:hypothetical protein